MPAPTTDELRAGLGITVTSDQCQTASRNAREAVDSYHRDGVSAAIVGARMRAAGNVLAQAASEILVAADVVDPS